MEKNIKDYLDERQKLLIKMIDMTEEKLMTAPAGRISTRHHGKNIYYYLIDENDEEKIIKKEDKELLGNLLQKSYLEKILKSAKRELMILNKIQKRYPEYLPEDIYEQLKSERQKLVKPIVLTDEQFKQRWQDQPYPRKPISDEVPFFETMRGERVRSKSEVIIADRLLISGIPYKYECPLNVGKRVIHPDFTILRLSDRRVVYYEHCGKLDDPEYAEDLVNRVNDYNHAGIIQGERLFMTFETSKTPLDVRVLDKMIKENFR
ncbi:MAG: coiled-coil domain-containing protein 60 [Saccharofermentans sp.]|nr:coiled-coil domain-containing protein 60 [Saccharofermentans sp.]